MPLDSTNHIQRNTRMNQQRLTHAGALTYFERVPNTIEISSAEDMRESLVAVDVHRIILYVLVSHLREVHLETKGTTHRYETSRTQTS